MAHEPPAENDHRDTMSAGSSMPRSNTPDRTSIAHGGATPTGMPAPYGRACLNCSRAKCRCIYRIDGAGCERCHRLKKDCQPAVPVRKRGVSSKKTSSSLSRTAQLERKLDGLVSLLTAHGGVISGSVGERGSSVDSVTSAGGSVQESLPAVSAAASSGTVAGAGAGAGAGTGVKVPPIGPQEKPLKHGPTSGAAAAVAAGYLPRTPESTSTTAVSTATATQIITRAPATSSATTPAPTSSASTHHHHHRPEIMGMPLCGFENNPVPLTTPIPPAGNTIHLDPALEPSPAEAEASLVTFRDKMLPTMPFAYIPPDVTAAQLRHDRPLFWLAIMSVVNNQGTLEAQLGRSLQLRTIFAQRAVVECEKSIDLLLAMLTFIVWIHFAARRDRPILSLFSQMAISLVYDLGLHKMFTPSKALLARFMRGGQTVVVEEMMPTMLSMEERRAALGCYVMASIVSIYLKRADTLRWTNRMEEHVQTLLANPETPFDHILVAQARLQRIADHIYAGEWQMSDQTIGCASTVVPPDQRSLFGPRVVPLFVARLLRSKIDIIKAAVPEELLDYDGFRGNLLAVEILLSGSVVAVPLSPPAGSAPSAAESHNFNFDYASCVNLARCVESIHNFWDYYRAIPSSSFAILPFSFFFYFACCVILLHSFSHIDNAVWDRIEFPHRLHLFEVLDDFIAKMRSAPQVPPSLVGDPEYWNIFQRITAVVCALRERWAAELNREDGNNDNSNEGNTPNPTPNHSGDSRTFPEDPLTTANSAIPPTALPPHSMPPVWCVPQPVVDMGQQNPQHHQPPPDPMMALGPNIFFPEFFQAMGMTDDSLLCDVFFQHEDGTAGQALYP